MTRAAIFTHLTTWEALYHAADTAWTALAAATGSIDSESPIGRAVWATFDAYTQTLGELIGDRKDWLHWYCYENDMGRNGYEASNGSEARRPIRFISDLADLILGDSPVEAPVVPDPASASPASYYAAGLRDLLTASVLHFLHQAGSAGLTVALVRDAIRAEHAAIFDAFQRLHRAGLASAPQRQTGRGRPFAWTITPAGRDVATRPTAHHLTVQIPLA